MDYKGDVDTSLATHLASARKGAKDWKGTPPASTADPGVALVGDGAELDRQPLTLLEGEIARLEKLVSVDRDTASKFSALSKRITEENATLDRAMGTFALAYADQTERDHAELVKAIRAGKLPARMDVSP